MIVTLLSQVSSQSPTHLESSVIITHTPGEQRHNHPYTWRAASQSPTHLGEQRHNHPLTWRAESQSPTYQEGIITITHTPRKQNHNHPHTWRVASQSPRHMESRVTITHTHVEQSQSPTHLESIVTIYYKWMDETNLQICSAPVFQ